MQSAPFVLGLDDLITQAYIGRVAIMCAEAVPWKCHRSLIADALVAHGVAVVHIVGRSALQRHCLHHSAVVNPNGFVRYPAPSCLTCEHLI